MLSNPTTFSLLLAFSKRQTSGARLFLLQSMFSSRLATSAQQLVRLKSSSLALAPCRPVTKALVRYTSTATSKDILSHDDVDTMAGIKHDANTIKETLTLGLGGVPKKALYFGLAGIIPYFVTSLNTIYLSGRVSNDTLGGDGLLVSTQTAELLLHVLEPIHIGYGAVILTWLGAVHWGLEWAAYGGKIGYRRYVAGALAPAVAWPTLLMPLEFALIAQFCAFNGMLYYDAHVATRGWAPHWYGTYRFVLTFVIGASIVATLSSRQKLAGNVGDRYSLFDLIKALQYLQEKEEHALKIQTKIKEGED